MTIGSPAGPRGAVGEHLGMPLCSEHAVVIIRDLFLLRRISAGSAEAIRLEGGGL
jgi:hypothetical protein